MRTFLTAMLATLLLTGCLQKEIVDDVSIEAGVSYDSHDGRLKGTFAVPQYEPDKKVKNLSYTAVSTLRQDIIAEVQRMAADPLVTGSLEVAMFGEDLSRRGLAHLIDAFQRDPSIAERLYLAVTEGEAGKIIGGDYGTRGTAVYFADMLEHNIENRNVPNVNLHVFSAMYFQKGQDPFLPIIKDIGGGKAIINGLALFSGDKVVDKIPADNMFYFKLMVDRHTRGGLKVHISEEEEAYVRSIKSKFKLKIVKREPYELGLDIKVEGIIKEYSGGRLSPSKVKKIEDTMVKIIKEQCAGMTHRFQDKNIDPIGFGTYVRSRTRHFDNTKWQDEYKRLTVNVNPDVTLTEAGVLE
ncbi:Ger(x)C family spore germination protein [Bacillus canaveralius]|uniref:Ger(x)C family spore germination protein n=1 Tax=Bacillus canaveralius TaxID=1403243 RepID=UPI000F7B47BB|nr:Ger(x)C family spore germination protein [Bacillus canaveralius]RSK55499.1 Ger(x)C family spore germination protein [Bacillus canaveralius]